MTVKLNVSSTDIIDGRYPNLETGNDYNFAVEMIPLTSPKIVNVETPALNYMGDGIYEVFAQKKTPLLTGCGFQFFDVGFNVYSEDREDNLLFSVPAGFGFQSHARLKLSSINFSATSDENGNFIPIIYSWLVSEVSLLDAPWIESIDDLGNHIYIRDPLRMRYITKRDTNAVYDSGGIADYVIDLLLMDKPPQVPLLRCTGSHNMGKPLR